MRITLVTECFYPEVDGATATVRHLADQLIDAGHEVSLVVAGPGLPSYRKARIVRVRPFDRPGRQVREALRDLSPELVHVASPESGRLCRKALGHAQRVGIPAVVPPPEGWTPGVDTQAYSPALRDGWLHAKWARAGTPHGPLVVVGYAGPLRRSHGVRALAGLRDVPGIRPVVIGDGPQDSWLRRTLPEAKLVGRLEGRELAVALASLDVLVHTCRVGGCHHWLVEAAASAVPVVAPRAGAARHVVRHLETGLLHDPAQPGELRRAVASLAADSRRSELGTHARQLVSGRTWQVAVDDLLGPGVAAPGRQVHHATHALPGRVTRG